MANITKQKRDQMIAFLEKLKKEHSDDVSVRAFNEIENHLTEKKFGLVFEEHTEYVDEMLLENIPVLSADDEKRICRDEKLPWNFILEGDNLQALYLLEKTHLGKIDCVYIDHLIIRVLEIGNIIMIMLKKLMCLGIVNGYQ